MVSGFEEALEAFVGMAVPRLGISSCMGTAAQHVVNPRIPIISVDWWDTVYAQGRQAFMLEQTSAQTRRVVGIRERISGVRNASELYPDLNKDSALQQIGEFQDGVFAKRRILGEDVKTRIGRLLPQSLRTHMRIVTTNLMWPWQRARARRIRGPLRLHLGSGTLIKVGFVNVDLWGLPNVDVAWNLTRLPLPWGDETASIIFSEHVQEHLSLVDGLSLAKEAYRILEPRGVFRFAVPDPALHYSAYGDPRSDFFRRFGTFAIDIDAMNQLHYGERHRHMYDAYGGIRLLKAAGFEEINVCEPSRSGFLPENQLPDTDWRAVNSIYFEARK